MSLSTGLYTIRSAAFSEPFVARNPVEDRSFNPKRVLSLPASINSTVEWSVEDLGNDRYYLRNGGAPTAVINDLVYAILLTFPSPEEWDLQQLPQYGNNQYLIQTNNGTTGWVLPSADAYTQIESRPLIVQPSFPPQYPANQRWIIESLD